MGKAKNKAYQERKWPTATPSTRGVLFRRVFKLSHSNIIWLFMCVINNRTGYHSTAVRSTDNSVLRLCCCPVRHSSPSVMPSAGIIDDLVVATISPLETTSKGGLITPPRDVLDTTPVSIVAPTVDLVVATTFRVLITFVEGRLVLIPLVQTSLLLVSAPISLHWTPRYISFIRSDSGQEVLRLLRRHRSHHLLVLTRLIVKILEGGKTRLGAQFLWADVPSCVLSVERRRSFSGRIHPSISIPSLLAGYQHP
nr:hypothetical protein Iba_chr13aCG4260 [Ipomoea batatas]